MQAHPSLGLLRLQLITESALAYIFGVCSSKLCFQIIINILIYFLWYVLLYILLSDLVFHSVLSIRPRAEVERHDRGICAWLAKPFFLSFLFINSGLLLSAPSLVYFEDGASWCLICQCNILILICSCYFSLTIYWHCFYFHYIIFVVITACFSTIPLGFGIIKKKINWYSMIQQTSVLLCYTMTIRVEISKL